MSCSVNFGFANSLLRLDSSHIESSLCQKDFLKWKALGLDPEWFAKDPEGAVTLLSTRLVYPILGFQNTKEATDSEIRFNKEKNGIEIRVRGEFQLVKSAIRDRFIFSSDGGGTLQERDTAKNWTYLGTSGVVAVDRWTHSEFLPVLTLSKDQIARLQDHVKRHDKNFDPNRKPCFIQLVTNPRDLCFNPETIQTRLNRNYKKNFPIHAWIRLIHQNGEVYSTGFGSTQAEDLLQEKLGYFSTINGVPTILDYEEFRPHEGRITNTFAISEDAFKQTLEMIEKDRRDTVRFNILVQNCNTLAVKYLKAAGIQFRAIRMKVRDLFFESLPEELSLRRFKGAFHQHIPLPLKIVCQIVVKIFSTSMEYLISFLFLNPFLMIHGVNQKTKLAETKSSEDAFIENKRKIHLFSNAFDLEVEFSLKTIEDQISRKFPDESMWVHTYKSPNMSIVPPKENEEGKIREDSVAIEQLKGLYQKPFELPS